MLNYEKYRKQHSFSFSTFAIAFTLHLKTMSGNVLSFHKIFDILLLLD